MVVAQDDVPEHTALVKARWEHLEARMNRKVEEMGPINRASELRLLAQAIDAPTKTKSILWLRRAVEAVSAQVQKSSACVSGCSHCCNIAVDVTKTEALMIARATGRKLDPRVMTGEVVKKPAMGWYGVPCTFLEAGRCSAYASRPLACRTQFNMDDDDLLCKLVPGEEIRVPYLDMMHHKTAYAEAMGINEVYADIREWFPSEARTQGDAGLLK